MSKMPKTDQSVFNDVLHVLAIAVIIDEKILETEMNEFSRQAVGLAEICDAEFSPADAKNWFETNKPLILEKMAGRGRNTVILKALTRVTDEVLRENIYDSMIAISVSDKEYHREESDLIRSAATIWGYTRPPLKVTT